MLKDYSHLTEVTGSKVSREQLERMYNRYVYAAELSEGKDALEVGCGVGQGLGLIASKAKRVVGGDYTQSLVDSANAHYGDRIDVRQFDAQEMPFDDQSFDVVFLYETIYYVSKPEKFLDECRRVLRPGGKVVICSANKSWSGFCASPHSYRYFSVPELTQLLTDKGFAVECRGDCPTGDSSLKSKIFGVVRKLFVKFDLMPKNMKAKEKFKRLVFGKLQEMPAELKPDTAKYSPPVQIEKDRATTEYKVVFAVGTMV